MIQNVVRTGACIALTACSLFGQAVTNEAKAYVFDIKGYWRVGPQYAVDLVLGMALPAGETVVPHAEGRERAGYSISVGYIDGTVDHSNCGSSGADCTKALTIKKSLTGQGSPTAISERLQRIWESLTLADLPKTVLTMSRGRRLRDDPQETVVSVERGQPDLAPALATVMPGSFSAELTPISSGGQTTKISVNWMPPQAMSNGPPLEPGLYHFKLLAGGAESGVVTVLAAPTSRAAAVRNDFNAAAQVSRDWPESMAAARHDYLTAVLLQLAKEQPSGK